MSTAAHTHAQNHSQAHGHAPSHGRGAGSQGPVQNRRVMAIACPLGPDALLLRDATIHEELGRCFSIDADLCSRNAGLPFDQIVGEPMAIRLQREDGKTRFWHGICAAFDQVGEEGDLSLYRATIVPPLWRLSRRFDCRIFQHKNVADIVLEVLKQHGVTSIENALTEKYPQREFVVQYRESDLGFVQRLMEFDGIYYFFEHDQHGCKLVLADSPTAHRPAHGYETVKYRPTHDVSGAEAMRRWAIASTLSTGRVALDDFDFASPSKQLLAKSAAHTQRPGAELEAYDYPGAYTDLSDGERYARIRLQEIECRRAIVRAAADARGLACGSTFALTEHPRHDQNRKWLITQATHVLRSDEFLSPDRPAHTDLPIYECTLHAQDASVHFRPDRRTPRPTITGPQTAIVVGAKGEEIHTDNHGRVRVRFHWDRYATGDHRSSCFIRSNQPWAGKGWGGIQIPRVGQEVILEFLEGDPDRPLITGRVYNGESMPPVSGAGRNPQKGEVNPANMVEAAMQMTLRSSSLGGSGGHNEITMHDSGGAEKLFIRAQKDEVHNVLNDRLRTIGRDESVFVARNRDSTIGGDEVKAIAGSRSTTIGGDEDRAVTGSRTTNIGEDQGSTVEGSSDSHVAKRQHESTGENRVIDVLGGMGISVGKLGIAPVQEGTFAVATTNAIKQSAAHSIAMDSGLITLITGETSESGSIRVSTSLGMQSDGLITLSSAKKADVYIGNAEAYMKIGADGNITLFSKQGKILLNCPGGERGFLETDSVPSE